MAAALPLGDPADPTRLGIPCNGCSQPRNNANAQFSASTFHALKENEHRGCPTCRLILQGLEKCIGNDAIGRSKRLLLVSNGAGRPDFHVIVNNDEDQTVSFFVSPGNDRTLVPGSLRLSRSDIELTM